MNLENFKNKYAVWSSENEILLDIYQIDFYNNMSLSINNQLLNIYKNGYYIDEIIWLIHSEINNHNLKAMGGIKDNKNPEFYYAETNYVKSFKIEYYNKIPSYIYNFVIKNNENNKFYPCLSIKKVKIKFTPSLFKEDEKKVISFLNTKKQVTNNKLDINSMMTGILTFNHNQEDMIIPYRNYYEEITNEEYNQFNDIQKCILDCIMTLNCNGYIRENHLKNILKTNYGFEQFYIFNLATSYVVEILEIIFNSEKNSQEKYTNFVKQNKKLIENGYQKMLSYFDLYYKYDNPNLKNYTGYKIFREIFMISRNGKSKN